MSSFTYDDFIAKVNEMGFILPIEGYPSEQSFIENGQMWSGSPDLDPWLWKDKAPAEKKLAYTSIGSNKKGFIAPAYYSIFYDAFHPHISMEDRRNQGKIGQYEWKMWELLRNEKRPLGTHEYRSMLGVTPKNGGSSLNTAITNMQLSFDLTLTGGVEMLDKNGIAYNTSVGCGMVEEWVPSEWMKMNKRMSHDEAFEVILARANKVSGLPVDILKKSFTKQLNLLKNAEK